MPGDSSGYIADSVPLPDSLSKLHAAVFPVQTKTDDGTWFFLVIVLFAGIIGLAFLLNRLREKYLQKQAYKAAQQNFSLYDEWLSNYNGYYKSLPAVLRERFLERVSWFMSTKTFTYINLPGEEKMPLLI